MQATPALFPDMVLVDDDHRVKTLRERWAELSQKADEVGGLCPQAAIADVLGVHRSRVYELLEHGKLEGIEFMGQRWVTGRSVAHWLSTPPTNKGGRGKKRQNLWSDTKFAGKMMLAVGGAVASSK